MTVSLTPVNDETPTCSSATYTATEDEAQAIGTAITLSPVFSCSDVDVDSNDKITYTLSGQFNQNVILFEWEVFHRHNCLARCVTYGSAVEI